MSKVESAENIRGQGEALVVTHGVVEDLMQWVGGEDVEPLKQVSSWCGVFLGWGTQLRIIDGAKS